MKWWTLLVIAVTAATGLSAQGYAWEWSPRAPRTMPTLFGGVEIATGYAMHTGTLPYVEDLVPCCTFEEGTGIPVRFAVFLEDWIAPSTALTYGGGVTIQNSSFTSTAQALPDSGGRQIITEYLFDASMTYLQLQGGIRQRLFGYVSVGLELRGLISVASSYELTERVVAPDDFFFSTNPPSKEITLTPTVVDQASVFVLEPAVSLQYDIPLGIGMVLSPMVQFSVPVMSLANNVSWRFLSVTGGVRLSRGL